MSKSIYSPINNWKAVCKKIGHDPKVLPDVSNLDKDDQKDTTAFFMAKKIAKAINMIDEENGNKNTPVYAPYFYKDPFSFRITDYGIWIGGSVVLSARLLFRTRAGAEHAGKTFLKIYKDLINGK